MCWIAHLWLHKTWIQAAAARISCSNWISMQYLLFIMAITGPASQNIDIIKRQVALSNVETIDYFELISTCRVSVFSLKIWSISGYLWELTAAPQGVVALSLRTVAIMLSFTRTLKWQGVVRIGRICVSRKMISEQAVIGGGSRVIGKVEAQKYSENIWGS